jgi:capsular polysaccharide transport system permease protein
MQNKPDILESQTPPAPAGGEKSAGTAPSQGASSSPFTMPVNPRRPGPVKRRIMLISALLVIGLPTLAAGIYYAFFASDQYASSGHFVVRHRGENTAALSSLSMLGLGTTGTSSTPDMMVVNDYLMSMQMIKDLAPKIDLRAIYDTPRADRLARLTPAWGEDTVSDERLHDYWQKMAVVHFDTSTGLSTFEVRAFTADDSKNIADHVFALGEALVNRLSKRAQEDALSLAKQEVETYRDRAIASLDALQAFQERAKQVDPEAFAQARAQIQAGVEQELTQLQTQLDVLRKNLPEDAPGITQVKDRLASMEKQLAAERVRSTVSETGESAAQILNEFAKLRLESEFATQAYMSSLASLESARLEAMRQNLYLETFVRPHVPQVARYPSAFLGTLLVFVCSLLVWAIGGLFVSAIREHV